MLEDALLMTSDADDHSASPCFHYTFQFRSLALSPFRGLPLTVKLAVSAPLHREASVFLVSPNPVPASNSATLQSRAPD